MIVGDDYAGLERAVASVTGFVDAVYLVCSHDAKRARARAAKPLSRAGELEHVALSAYARPFDDYGRARTAALEVAAAGSHTWTLMLDADMTAEWHPELESWLAADPYPEVGAWTVTVRESGIEYQLPLLTRRAAPAMYRGAVHEYLEHGGAGRPLLGLVVTHHADGTHREGKLERDLELMRGGLVAREPRAVYYSAQAYRDLGDTERAVALYRLRAGLEGWDEETWHAAYQAAKLSGDVPELIRVWSSRPWRHEPLSAAAELVKRDERAELDRLFREP